MIKITRGKSNEIIEIRKNMLDPVVKSNLTIYSKDIRMKILNMNKESRKSNSNSELVIIKIQVWFLLKKKVRQIIKILRISYRINALSILIIKYNQRFLMEILKIILKIKTIQNNIIATI